MTQGMNQKYSPISVQFPQPGQRYSFKQSCQGNRFEAGGSGPCHVRMEKCAPFTYVKTSPEIIRQAATLQVRFPLSPGNAEDLLHERGAALVEWRNPGAA